MANTPHSAVQGGKREIKTNPNRFNFGYEGKQELVYFSAIRHSGCLPVSSCPRSDRQTDRQRRNSVCYIRFIWRSLFNRLARLERFSNLTARNCHIFNAFNCVMLRDDWQKKRRNGRAVAVFVGDVCLCSRKGEKQAETRTRMTNLTIYLGFRGKANRLPVCHLHLVRVRSERFAWRTTEDQTKNGKFYFSWEEGGVGREQVTTAEDAVHRCRGKRSINESYHFLTGNQFFHYVGFPAPEDSIRFLFN